MSSLAFIGLMDRKYFGTFFTTMTAKQSTTMKFKTAKNDQQKINVLKYYPTYYEEVEVELQELIDENWEDWMADRPEWLTDNVIASIPDNFLPKPEVKRLEKEGGGKRRRSSAFGGTGGSGRASAKVQPNANANDSEQPPAVHLGVDLESPRISNQEQSRRFRKSWEFKEEVILPRGR